MRNYNLKKSILGDPWAISPEVASRFSYLIDSLFMANLESEPLSETRAASVVGRVPVLSSIEGESKLNSVGLVNIVGALTKYDPECDYGMESYGAMVQELDSDSDVVAIVLKIDSPGGTVAGTEELGRIIKSVSKPTIAFISGQACSAAYWLACCADEIIADSDLAEVGSIGVLATFVDLTEQLKKQGIKLISVYASQSEDKNKAHKELMKGNTKPIQDVIDAFADKFISVVKSNRSGVLDEQLTGNVYFAKDVIGSLVDSIGTIDDACRRASELSNQNASVEETQNNSAFTETNNNNIIMNQKPNLNRVLGVDELASIDGSVSLNEEQLDALETALVARNQEQAQEQLSVEEQLAQARAELATANEKNVALEARLAKPAEAPASVAAKVDVAKEDSSPAATLAEAFASVNDYQDVI